jgi:hypothetical protein
MRSQHDCNADENDDDHSDDNSMHDILVAVLSPSAGLTLLRRLRDPGRLRLLAAMRRTWRE